MKYKCKVPGCSYETDNRHGYAGHMKGHVNRGEAVKKGSRELPKAKLPEPQPQLPSPSEIADALLNTAVDAINREQSLEEQLRVAKARIASLTEEIVRAEGERDRVIKIHDDQVREANKHRTELPSTKTLMEAAKLR